MFKTLRRIHLRQSVKIRRVRVKLFVLSVEKLLTEQTSNDFATTYGHAFMMPDGQGNDTPVVTYLIVYCSFISVTVCTQQPSLTADDRCNWCLVKRDQSAAMLAPNYFFIFCILIKNSQKMAYIMNTLSEFLNKLLKQQKQLHFLFRSYKPIQ